MPFDRNDPRDERLDDPKDEAAPREADADDLADALCALFEMFGGEVVDLPPPD